MKIFRRNVLNHSILMAFAAPAAMIGFVAHAQEAAPATTEQAAPATEAKKSDASESTGGIETVVVSARRKKESLQDVPTAITAISAKDIAALKIETIADVGQNAPNVQVEQQGGSLAPEIRIRGIANGSLNIQVDSGIGAYVDGVYLGRLSGAAFDIADLNQIEIMRGPQGTLFGRNSTGGAINLITADPTGELGFHSEAGVGNYRASHEKISLDLPDVHGLDARVTVGHRQNDGYVTNTAPIETFKVNNFGSYTTSKNAPAANTDSALIALSYKGVKDLTVDYKYDWSQSTQTMAYRQILSLDPAVSAGVGLPAVSVPVGFGYLNRLPAEFESPTNMNVQGQSLKVGYLINDNLSVKYIGSYRQYNINYGLNGVDGAGLWTDGTTFSAPLLSLRNESQHQSTHEFQLLGKSGRLDWIGGLFYFDEHASNDNPVMLSALGFPGLRPGVPYTINPDTDYFVGQKDQVNNKSFAEYAHANYTINDNWVISGGVRHTKDTRMEHVSNAGRLAFGSTVILPGIVGQDFSYSGTHNDYDLSATYKINKTNNVYTKVSTGYVSGGTLMGQSFLPETAISYEAGLKSTMFDNRLRTNVAIFKMDRKNLQIENFGATGYSMSNVGTSTTKGLELEVAFKPIDALSLNGSLGLSDVTNSGQFRTYQPKVTASLGASYNFARFGDGILPTLRVDGTYMSYSTRLACPAGMAASNNTCTGTENNALDAASKIPATKHLGASLTFADIRLGAGATGKVTVWGRNLLNQTTTTYDYTLGGNTVAGIFQSPRTFGIDFAVDF